MARHTNRLLPYLRRAGMTQAELAKTLRVSPEWISRIANGRAVFSETVDARIIHAINDRLEIPLTPYEVRDMFGFPGPGFRPRTRHSDDP